MRKRKPIELTCIDCGAKFMAYATKALRCEKCKIEAIKKSRRATNQVYMQQYKKIRKIRTPHLSYCRRALP